MRSSIVTSTGALELDKVPGHLVVIGAGIIGLELGSVWRRLGAEVTVVEFLDRIVPGMDTEVATAFQRILTKQGLKFRLGTKVTGAQGGRRRRQPDGGAGQGRRGGNPDRRHRAAGDRPPAVHRGPGPGRSGRRAGRPRARRQPTTHYATNVPGIYAIGDVIAGPMLAHKGEDEGVAVAEILAGQAGHVNYDAIPSVVYTWPEVACGRPDRGRAESRRHRLQRRQIPVHRQRPRPGDGRHRWVREAPGRQGHATGCWARTSSARMPAR